MTAKTRNCERCWLKGRNITPAMYHIDDQDLCRPCAQAEGYDVSQYTPLEQPKPVEILAQTSAQIPVLTNDVLGVARRRRQAAEKVERARKKSESPVAPRQKKTRAPKKVRVPLEPRTCAHEKCAKTFMPSRSNQNYCSHSCYIAKYRQTNPRVPKQRESRRCADPNCGREFIPRQTNSHYCSRNCYQRHWYQQKNDVQKPRAVGPVLGPKRCEAEGCGKEFVPSTAAARFCSQTCYQRDFKRRKAAQHRLEPRQCAAPACGQSFQPKRKDQRFCSDACKSAEHYARRKRVVAPAATGLGISPERMLNDLQRADFSGGSVSIRVSEAALDRFWASLPVTEKAAIFARNLEAQSSL